MNLHVCRTPVLTFNKDDQFLQKLKMVVSPVLQMHRHPLIAVAFINIKLQIQIYTSI